MASVQRFVVAAVVVGLFSTVYAAEENLIQLAEGDPDLSILVKACSAAGLVPTLEGPGPFTVFAPTNKAFEKLPNGTLQKLLDPANKAELVNILEYHIIKGEERRSKTWQMGEKLKMMNGGNVTVTKLEGHIYLLGGPKGDHAQLLDRDVEATNGLADTIAMVLIPTDMDLTTLK
eukprot:m.331684 g.331684  ORF g.331684 m.331684 type:complete len:175 (+) comp16779_c0_seq1:26-550(+)